MWLIIQSTKKKKKKILSLRSPAYFSDVSLGRTGSTVCPQAICRWHKCDLPNRKLANQVCPEVKWNADEQIEFCWAGRKAEYLLNRYLYLGQCFSNFNFVRVHNLIDKWGKLAEIPNNGDLWSSGISAHFSNFSRSLYSDRVRERAETNRKVFNKYTWEEKNK